MNENNCVERRNVVMRCDAIFHLMKIKTFTKRHLIRIKYMNINGEFVSTNALRLKFPSIRTNDDTQCEEIIYIHSDFRALFRSWCSLSKNETHEEWSITSENILSRTDIMHLDELTKLFASYTGGTFNNFNLTTLRKTAQKKSNNDDAKEIVLHSHVLLEELNGFDHQNTGYLASAITTIRHVLKLQIHVGSVVFSHAQFDSSGKQICLDYLAKSDIISFVEFLRLNMAIFSLQTKNDYRLTTDKNETSSVFHASVLKLDFLCEQLANDRAAGSGDKGTAVKRKRKFQQICDQALLEEKDTSLLTREEKNNYGTSNDFNFEKDFNFEFV